MLSLSLSPSLPTLLPVLTSSRQGTHTTRRTKWVGTHKHVLRLSLPDCFQDTRRHAAQIEAGALVPLERAGPHLYVRSIAAEKDPWSATFYAGSFDNNRSLPQSPPVFHHVQTETPTGTGFGRLFGPLLWSRHPCPASEAHSRSRYRVCSHVAPVRPRAKGRGGWSGETEYGILGSNLPSCQVPNHTRPVRRVLPATLLRELSFSGTTNPSMWPVSRSVPVPTPSRPHYAMEPRAAGIGNGGSAAHKKR